MNQKSLGNVIVCDDEKIAICKWNISIETCLIISKKNLKTDEREFCWQTESGSK